MAKKPKQEDNAVPADLGYEQAVEELEELVERIESGEASLEKCLDDAERASKLIQHCRGVLDRAEQRIAEMSDDTPEGDAPEDAAPEAELDDHADGELPI